MSAFERFLLSLQGRMETPSDFGAFHLITLAVVILATLLLCVFFRDTSDKNYRIILFLFWLGIVLLEIYKQLVFSVYYEENVVRWQYRWHAFPFQFCDTPFFVIPLVIFLREGSMREAASTFLSTYALLAGIVVLLLPSCVFTSYIGLNIHTMFHHGTQVVVGAFIVAHKRERKTIHHFLYAMPLFFLSGAIALALDLIMHKVLPTEPFNMFFISPYYISTLPLLGSLSEKIGWGGFVALYFIGFTIASFLLFAAEHGVRDLFKGEKRPPALRFEKHTSVPPRESVR